MDPICTSCGEEYGPGLSVPSSPITGICDSCAQELFPGGDPADACTPTKG